MRRHRPGSEFAGAPPTCDSTSKGSPSDWHLKVERIIGEGPHAASWIEFSDAGDHYPGLCFFDLDENGRIARITDFWPMPTELPATRAHLVERY
jgi:hypothetical protein